MIVLKDRINEEFTMKSISIVILITASFTFGFLTKGMLSNKVKLTEANIATAQFDRDTKNMVSGDNLKKLEKNKKVLAVEATLMQKENNKKELLPVPQSEMTFGEWQAHLEYTEPELKNKYARLNEALFGAFTLSNEEEYKAAVENGFPNITQVKFYC